MDVALAVLIVAAKLERQGRPLEARLLKTELGLLVCRAAIYESEHPEAQALLLGREARGALGLVGTAGVEPAASALSRRRSTTELRAKVGTKVGTRPFKKRRNQ